MTQKRTCLTVAGSDSGGGAGLQADLAMFAVLGVHGTSAVTCVTAQNPSRVTGVEPVSPEMVAEQMRTVCDGFAVAAAKTGMLYSADIVAAVASVAQAWRVPFLVVDPVMVATSGARLLKEDAVQVMRGQLIPQATVVTPNVPEAEVLCGREIVSVDDLGGAAEAIGREFGVACVVKGGHLGEEADEIVDVLYADGEQYVVRGQRVAVSSTHGTGCRYSAAITACLAQEASLAVAVARAQAAVRAALETPGSAAVVS